MMNDAMSKVGINHFADWTEEERKQLLGFRRVPRQAQNYALMDTKDLPESVDWREKGGVTPLKN